jgi:DNA polymerase-3 subunit gamma/tau
MKSLYREYRPKTFSDVIGQNHVTQTLVNQIKSGRISHAYLFCGTRGTGKTSVAKIFASNVNNTKGADIDIFEIDAASNNSVTDVRELIDKVKYPPVVGKYKIYIIDEVHMFSPSAFNAFLKTLEEPPAHIIFILCTTEPHKLLATVQSRVLRFDFRPVATADIEKLLTKILSKEQIHATADAIKMLATAGCGSVRDALSFTETVIGYAGSKEITATAVGTVLGTVGDDALSNLLSYIIAKNTAKISTAVEKIFSVGINTNMLVKNFIEVIKREYIHDPKYGTVFKIFGELELTIKQSPDARTHFENACLLATAE